MRMTRRKSLRGAFTIVELLVTLTIIVMMVSLLLGAITATRESARRASCINNMRQIALSLQNYETSFHSFPSGVVNPTGPIHNTPDDLHIGWIVQILPYMEQNCVARAIDTDLSVYDPVNRTGAATRISSLRCASDRSNGLIKGIGASSYAACHHEVEAPIDVNNHGVFFLNSNITYADITDGSSTTILVGEKLTTDLDLGWISGTNATLRNTGTTINTVKDLTTLEMVGGFASSHPGGANFMFGDGSVRFLHNSIPQDLYQRLGHRADGELVGEGPY